MTLYEIDQAILACVDPETGEILTDDFETLQMERDCKIENIAVWIKSLQAEAAALRREKAALEERQKAKENKAKSLSSYLASVLNGEKFETAKCKVSFRSSEALEIEEGTKVPEEYLRFKDPAINKAALKDAIKQGEVIDGVSLVKRQNLQIK